MKFSKILYLCTVWLRIYYSCYNTLTQNYSTRQEELTNPGVFFFPCLKNIQKCCLYDLATYLQCLCNYVKGLYFFKGDTALIPLITALKYCLQLCNYVSLRCILKITKFSIQIQF